MKTHDRLGRRNRYQRLPLGDSHYLQDCEVEALSFMHRHGGRSTLPLFHASIAHLRKSEQWTNRRLKILFQELALLDRPKRQRKNDRARSTLLVYELNDLSTNELKKRGLLHENAPRFHGPFEHQTMFSYLSSCLELNAKGTHITYTPQHLIIKKPYVEVEGEKVKPDGICMLEAKGVKYLVYIEADRANEATRSENIHRKSLQKNIRQYKQIMRENLFRAQQGIAYDKQILLIATVSEAKMYAMLEIISEEYPKGCSNILVRHFPQFGDEFSPPGVMDLLGTYWQRSGYPPHKFLW